MKTIFIGLFYGCSLSYFAQTVTPSVIHTSGGGGTVGATGVEVYYNIGEPIISTVNNTNYAITQGFLQPEIVGEFDLSVTPLFQNESCLNKKDGLISMALNSAPSSALQILYIWSPAFVCPSQNCAGVNNLSPGTYSVTIKAMNSANVAIDSVLYNYTIAASTEPCQITVYNGFTPDGDGLNDHWIIENIENFPINTVTIFNRWGNIIWSTKNYDNSSNVWNGQNQNGMILPSGTYFYIIEIDNGSAVKKGWVELTGK